jgi:hypothetical protein
LLPLEFSALSCFSRKTATRVHAWCKEPDRKRGIAAVLSDAYSLADSAARKRSGPATNSGGKQVRGRRAVTGNFSAIQASAVPATVLRIDALRNAPHGDEMGQRQ